MRCCSSKEDLSSEEVEIDQRIHSRLIGSKGRGIHRIMDEFKVDIRFPGRDAKDPNLVVISGAEDAVQECKEHLLNLQEEYVSSVLLTLVFNCLPSELRSLPQYLPSSFYRLLKMFIFTQAWAGNACV